MYGDWFCACTLYICIWYLNLKYIPTTTQLPPTNTRGSIRHIGAMALARCYRLQHRRRIEFHGALRFATTDRRHLQIRYDGIRVQTAVGSLESVFEILTKFPLFTLWKLRKASNTISSLVQYIYLSLNNFHLLLPFFDIIGADVKCCN